MFLYLRNKRGQTTLEYGVVFAAVVAGLIAMQTYMKRSVQGKARESSDKVGDQFSPVYSTGTVRITSNSSSSNSSQGAAEDSFSTSHHSQTQDVHEVISPLASEGLNAPVTQPEAK